MRLFDERISLGIELEITGYRVAFLVSVAYFVLGCDCFLGCCRFGCRHVMLLFVDFFDNGLCDLHESVNQ
jgi:hypothetical protein